MSEVKQVRLDPLGLVAAVVYVGVCGWVMGRVMLRNEQAREAAESHQWTSIFQLQEDVARLQRPEPGPAKPAKK